MIKKSICHRGFTLIEVILAVALIAIVGTAVYATFSAGLMTNKRSKQQSDMGKEMFWTFDLISRECEQMVPYDFSGSYENKKVFVGEDHKIQFLLPTKDGLKIIRYYLANPAEGHIHKVIVGERYAKNVSFTNIFTKGKRVEYLIRESIDFRDYLTEDNPTGEAEVISSSVMSDGFKFTYSFGSPEDILPQTVTMDVEFLNNENTGRSITLSRKIVIPTSLSYAK